MIRQRLTRLRGSFTGIGGPERRGEVDNGQDRAEMRHQEELFTDRSTSSN